MQLDHTQVKTLKGDRIWVKHLGKKKMVGSLYLPENHKGDKDRELWYGKVMKFGEDVNVKQLEFEGVKVGSVVIIRPFASNCPSFEGKHKEDFIVIREEDLEGVYEGDESEWETSNGN